MNWDPSLRAPFLRNFNIAIILFFHVFFDTNLIKYVMHICFSRKKSVCRPTQGSEALGNGNTGKSASAGVDPSLRKTSTIRNGAVRSWCDSVKEAVDVVSKRPGSIYTNASFGKCLNDEAFHSQNSLLFVTNPSGTATALIDH